MSNLRSPSIADLAEALAGPPAEVFTPTDFQFVPDLTPEQMAFYTSPARFCLAHGERFSGKTFVAGHKICEHLWSNWNALVVIIVSVRRQGTDGGIFQTLLTELFPVWTENQPGFKYTEQKNDAASKDMYVWVTNKFGGWSQVKLVSMPFGSNLDERVRGTAPSMIYVDEAGKVDGPGFFTVLMGQLGRRPHIPVGRQQWVGTCNPEGKSHWLYKQFFEQPIREDGSWDDRYATIYLPVSGNPDPRAQEYFENIREGLKTDPIEYRRLVLGEWIDRPSGDAIFGAHFNKNIHVRGDAKTRAFLTPKPRLPITVGADLGDVHHALVFMQQRSTEDKDMWIVFDDITVNQAGVSFDILVPAILDKMNFWCETCKYDFTWQFISDKSAFNRYRASSGSYDHLHFERLSRELLAETPERWPHIHKPIRMLACPKPPGSVAGRIKVLMNLLGREEIHFSAKAARTIEAVANLESEKDEPFEPSRKNDHVHPFDALTYPLFYHALSRPRVPTSAASPIIHQMGAN